MKAKFSQTRFTQALESVAKVLPAEGSAQSKGGESSTPHVLVSARRPDRIALTATDFETAISAVFTGAEIEEEGSELLPASDLFEVLRETPAENVAIRSEEKSVRLTVGPLVYSCNREDSVELFPSRYAPRSAEPVGTAKAKDLANLFRKTTLATDSTGTRWNACVRLEFEQNEIIGIGSDGRRMVVQKIPYQPAGNGLIDPILISTATAKHAQKLLDKQNAHASIFMDTQQVWFSILGPRTLDCSEFYELAVAGWLNYGGYPLWRNGFPETDPAWSCEVKINVLSEAVGKTREYTRADGDVFLAFEAGALTVQPRDRLLLGATRIPVNRDGKKEVRMRFSYKLLRSILWAFKSSATVTVNVWGDEMPLVLRTDDCQCAVAPKRWPKSSGTF